MPELGEPISDRELDVLNCLAEGASNREIADRLSISHNTVKVHVRNIYTKLGVSSRTEATTVALQRGMLSIPGLESNEATQDDAEEEAEAPAAAGEMEDEQAAPENKAVAAAPQPFLSRRNLPGIIGLLAIVALVVTVASLLLDRRGSALSPTAEAGDPEATGEVFEEVALGDNWVESRALPEARSRMALATVGLNVYAIGGEGKAGVDNRVYIFDSQQEQWRQGAPKLTAVAGAAVGVLAGEIYVAGGAGENGQATTAVEAYSPLNNAWRPVAALPRPVVGAVAIVSDGRLYLFGGEDGETALADALVYDPGRGQWQSLPPLHEARAMATGGGLNSHLYVMGGSDGGGPLASCERFDPAAAEWSECPPLQQARAAAGSAVFLNKLYVLGGDVNGGGSFGEVYDPAEESWSTFNMPMLAEDTDWPFLGVSNVENHIYAVGGERGGQASDGLYIYRPLAYTFFIPAASAGGGE